VLFRSRFAAIRLVKGSLQVEIPVMEHLDKSTCKGDQGFRYRHPQRTAKGGRGICPTPSFQQGEPHVEEIPC